MAQDSNASSSSATFVQKVLDSSKEDPSALQWIHLITMSRLIAAAGSEYKDLQGLSRKDIADAVRDSFNNLLPLARAAADPT